MNKLYYGLLVIGMGLIGLGVSREAHPDPQYSIQLDTSVFTIYHFSQARTVNLTVQEALTCLTNNVYYEAAGEGYEGKLAVATVTLNRVRSRHYPNNVCGVVYQSNSKGCQFSWTCGPGRKDIDPKLYRRAQETAREALYGDVRNRSIGNALFFHRYDLPPPKWTENLEMVGRIRSHVFYAYRRK
jgi:spore germination cell wall hydrolase CwlJ-like protein